MTTDAPPSPEDAAPDEPKALPPVELTTPEARDNVSELFAALAVARVEEFASDPHATAVEAKEIYEAVATRVTNAYPQFIGEDRDMHEARLLDLTDSICENVCDFIRGGKTGEEAISLGFLVLESFNQVFVYTGPDDDEDDDEDDD